MTLLKTILATFGSLFKVLKFASILAPFAWFFSKFSALFSFLPGGSIMGIIGGIFSAIGWVFKWMLADFLDGWKEPQRLVARLICFMIMLGVGVYCGIKYDGERAQVAEARLNKTISDLKVADDTNKSKLSAALAAKAKAEAAERALAQAPPPTTPVAPPAVTVTPPATSPADAATNPPGAAPADTPKRVRHAKSKNSSKDGGSWVSRFW